MSAYSKLVVEGKKACDALARETAWSREEWARSVRTLERAGLFPEIGLEQVFGIVAKTNAPPDDIARLLVESAKDVVRQEAQRQLDAGTLPTSVTVVHEKTTVCHARHRDYPLAPHLHDCQRLTGHQDDPTDSPHRCACSSVW